MPHRTHPRCTVAAGDELVFSFPEDVGIRDGIYVRHFNVRNVLENMRHYRVRIAQIAINGVQYVLMPQLDYEILIARHEQIEKERARLEKENVRLLKERARLEEERDRLLKESALLDEKLSRLEKEYEDLKRNEKVKEEQKKEKLEKVKEELNEKNDERDK